MMSSCRHRPNGIPATVGKTSASISSLARQCVSRSRSRREGQRAHHGCCTQGKLGISAKLPLVFFLDARTGGCFQEVSTCVYSFLFVAAECICLSLCTELSTYLDNCRITLIYLLFSLNAGEVHPEFRLWLSSKPTTAFPPSILHSSIKVSMYDMQKLPPTFNEPQDANT